MTYPNSFQGESEPVFVSSVWFVSDEKSPVWKYIKQTMQLERKGESLAEPKVENLRENCTEAFNNIKNDRDKLVALVKRKDQEIGECSVIIENVKKQMEEKEMVERSTTDTVMSETVKKLDEMTDSNTDLPKTGGEHHARGLNGISSRIKKICGIREK